MAEALKVNDHLPLLICLDTDKIIYIAAMKNPTNPDSAVESRASSTQLDNTLMASTHSLHAGLQNQMHQNLSSLGGSVTPGMTNPYGESNYEVFDPVRKNVHLVYLRNTSILM
jgi:hypothetical protein